MKDHPVTPRLRVPLGVALLIGGGALVFWSATSVRLALAGAIQGLPLPTLIGVALGLACLGASLDLFGFGRKAEPPSKIRNTKVYGAAEPASEPEAKAAARGDTQAPLHDRTFAD
jgi:hypothetical protein